MNEIQKAMYLVDNPKDVIYLKDDELLLIVAFDTRLGHSQAALKEYASRKRSERP